MKRLVFLIALGWLTIGTWAQQLTEQEAKDRALQYLGASPGPSKGRGERSFKAEGRKMTSAKVGAKKIYAFNREGGGFFISNIFMMLQGLPQPITPLAPSKPTAR